MENTVFALPSLDAGGIPESIPVYLSYNCAHKRAKGTVDRAMLSHFKAIYPSVQFSDPANGWVFASASTMADVQSYLEWASRNQGSQALGLTYLPRP